jgi:hypothetical protein
MKVTAHGSKFAVLQRTLQLHAWFMAVVLAPTLPLLLLLLLAVMAGAELQLQAYCVGYVMHKQHWGCGYPLTVF